jgi:O-antigen/teichoic acid export membrane protein
MINKFKSLSEDKFLKNNAIYFCGTLIVSIFNYIYHPVLGRMMSVEEFGEVQTLISLFSQLAIPVGIFGIIVLNIVSNQKTKEGSRETILMLYKFSMMIAIVIGSLIIICSPFLKSFFNFSSFYPFISLAAILFFGFLLAFRVSVLQAAQNFKIVSIGQIFASAGKLIFAVILVYAGWSSFGAISAIILAQIAAFLYIAPKAKKVFDFNGWNIKIDMEKIKKELKYGSLILIVSLCVTFLYTADVMIVKHYFPSETAGLYSGVAIIARIIFFITGSVVGVLLPSVKLEDEGNSNSNSKILKKSLFLIFSMSGTALIIFSFFPEFIIKILIGERYLTYAYLLPRLSLLLFLTSVINLLFYYLLAIRNYKIAFIAIAGISITAISSFFFHNTLIHVINNFLFGAFVILGLLFILFAQRRGWRV